MAYDWDGLAIERIRQLWADGHSAAEIGRRMGISKNAVVGKVHRLNLSARPSPILRSYERKDVKRTLPAEHFVKLADLGGSDFVKIVKAHQDAKRKNDYVVEVTLDEIPSVAKNHGGRPLKSVFEVGAGSSTRTPALCCWPIGEPGQRDFHFCDSDAVPGRPYCLVHLQRAYVRPRQRQGIAA